MDALPPTARANDAEPPRERNASYRRVMMQCPADVFGLFEAICDAWSLSRATRRALLGDIGRARYATWCAKPSRVRLSLTQVERIAQVTSIANHLLSVYSGAPDSANTWVTSANRGTLYGGRPPIELMTTGLLRDLVGVRRDLAAWDRR